MPCRGVGALTLKSDHQHNNTMEIIENPLAPAIASGVINTLPVAQKRVSAAGNELGSRISFKTDASGKALRSPSNARAYLKETQPDLKGKELNAAVDKLWNGESDSWDRVMVSLSVEEMFSKGLRPVEYDLNKKGSIGSLKFKAYVAPADKSKLTALESAARSAAKVEAALMEAADRIASKFGVSLEAAYQIAKG